MSEVEKSAGISRTMFIVGLVVSILASSLISTVIAIQWARGPQGPPGPGGERVLFDSMYRTDQLNKTTQGWENVTGMSVTMTLERNSTLLIMFSTEATVAHPDASINWRARVGTTDAIPGGVWLQPPDTTGLKWTSVSYDFYQPRVSAGQYTVYIQWSVSSGYTAWVRARTLFVIALPE